LARFTFQAQKPVFYQGANVERKIVNIAKRKKISGCLTERDIGTNFIIKSLRDFITIFDPALDMNH
jgi:hypothetical protein